MLDADSIEADFEVFFAIDLMNIITSTRVPEIIDSIGKRSLDEFCSMIGNEAIRLLRKKARFGICPKSMTAHADGVVSNTSVSAAALLAQSDRRTSRQAMGDQERAANQGIRCKRCASDSVVTETTEQ